MSNCQSIFAFGAKVFNFGKLRTFFYQFGIIIDLNLTSKKEI